MVDLPTKQYETVTTKQVTPGVSRSEIEEPYTELSNTLKRTGDAAETVATSLASQAGARAVTVDDQGNLQVEKMPFVGPAAAHYQHAVTIAALAQGEGQIRRKDIELRQQFRDNPQGYLAAATTFAKGIQQQWTDAAGPELGNAIRKTIEPITTQTFRGLLNEKEHLDLTRSVAAINSEIEVTKNDLLVMARGGITTGYDWDRRVAKVKALYGSLSTNPRLAYPQQKVDAEIGQFNGELQVQGLAHHVEDILRTRGVDEAMKVAETIRTDRSINLSPQARDTAYSRMVSIIGQHSREDERMVRDVTAKIKDVGDVALQGYPVLPEQMANLRDQVQTANRPELAAALAQTTQMVDTMKQWRTLSGGQLDAVLGGLDRTMREKGATPMGTAMLAAGQKLLTSMRTEVGKDPLGWSDRTGTMPVPPIQFGGADQLSQMSDRASRAETIAAHYGVPPTYLRPDEKHALQVVAAKGGDAMLGLAKTLVAGFGDRAPKVLAEISHDAPALAHVGALIQSGGNPVFAMDVADAVKLRADPDEAKKLPNWLTKPSDKVQQTYTDHARDVYGNAFALAPDSRRAAERAAQDAFFTRSYRNSYGPLSDDALAKDAYDTALRESAGGRKVEGNWYGGVSDYKPGFWTAYKVLVPQNVRADKFRDAIGAITADDLAKMGVSPMAADGRKYTPADLRSAVPVAVKGGYRFALGDPSGDDPKFIRGADGRPWVLDFDQMSERLRGRVPAAFMGGGGAPVAQ